MTIDDVIKMLSDDSIKRLEFEHNMAVGDRNGGHFIRFKVTAYQIASPDDIRIDLKRIRPK